MTSKRGRSSRFARGVTRLRLLNPNPPARSKRSSSVSAAPRPRLRSKFAHTPNSSGRRWKTCGRQLVLFRCRLVSRHNRTDGPPMQFLTVCEPKRAWYRIPAQTGGRDTLLNAFEYELKPDPTAERVDVRFGWGLFSSCPPALWPEITAGVQTSVEDKQRFGMRLHGICLTVLSVNSPESGTPLTPIRLRAAGCVTQAAVRYLSLGQWLSPEWLTSDVLALAKGLHADATTDRYPILSDALRDAGCEDAIIHDHLQLCPDHGPSCWVVEMILHQMRTAGV